jgi:hypothetical protein
MATIDDVYNKLLEVETKLLEVETKIDTIGSAQESHSAKLYELKKGQKDLESSMTKKIALIGTEVSRVRTLIK